MYLYQTELFEIVEIEMFLHLTVCKQKTVLKLNWIVWNRTIFTSVYKQMTDV